MTTNYKVTRNDNFIRAWTDRIVTIDTIGLLITMNSASLGMEICNNGPSSVFWASSGVVAGSGGFLAMYATKDFFNVTDTFNVYIRALSASGAVAVVEYQ